jgi:hypothetical protein
MPLYFLLHDAARFERCLRPALSEAWRRRSFAPCRALLAELAPAALAFCERFHVNREELLLFQLNQGLPFERGSWRLLVGEVLLYGAAEVPELQSAPETLTWLLAPEQRNQPARPRERFLPIEQAHFGARDLILDGPYRPEHAGWNDAADVDRLAAYLASCSPERWTVADLPGRPDSAEDAEEELEFARQCLFQLRDLYGGAAERGQVVVCEHL